MSSYLVRVSGVQAGTETVLGTVVSNERTDIDHYEVTFSTGQVKRFRYNQTLSVIEAR